MSATPDQMAMSREFVERLAASGSGDLEKLASAPTEIIRRRMREKSFSTSILPYDTINNDMLAQSLETEDPFVIYEMEADQFMPSTTNLEDTGNTVPFQANKFAMAFYANETPVWTKHIDQLRTYRADVREMVVDNALRDLERQKDKIFMNECVSIVGGTAGKISPRTRIRQSVLLPGRMDRDNVINSENYLPDRMLENGVWLTNRRTYNEIKRWTRNEMGGDLAQKLIVEGSKAFGKADFDGIPWIVTLMTDLVGNGELWQFAPPNYLGKAGVLDAPKMYLRKDKDIIRFSCREKIGLAIANEAAVQKVTFQDITGETGGDGQIIVA